ncbi:MAG: CPBP family intramembrane metalloprotease [Phycisphaerae bacterium]|nr:CPBP family intramembrane metalloprotease [Phycisphaerae bacterium]
MPIDDSPVEQPTPPIRTPWLGHLLSIVIAIAATVYLSLFWAQIHPWLPRWAQRELLQSRVWLTKHTIHLTQVVTGWTPTGRWIWATVGVAMALIIPWIFMTLIGRGRPRDLGIRLPNRVGWRLTLAAYLLSLPLLAAMAASPDTRAYYQREVFALPFWTVFGPYLAVLIAEHFFFHGVLLALLRPTRRWPVVPTPAPLEGSLAKKALRWIGLAQPTEAARGTDRIARWIGLPDACLLAMLLQSILFGLVHIGKSNVELAMSFPGGLALAYVAYRCNSWLVPMFLHAATGITVLALIRIF